MIPSNDASSDASDTNEVFFSSHWKHMLDYKEEVNHLHQRLGEAPHYQGMETAS